MPCKNFDCLYYAPTTETCDYLLITGNRRQCDSENCARYTTNPDKVKPLNKGYRLRRVRKEILDKLDAIYTPDITVAKLAEEVGVSKNYVALWGRKVHPEAEDKFWYRWYQ